MENQQHIKVNNEVDSSLTCQGAGRTLESQDAGQVIILIELQYRTQCDEVCEERGTDYAHCFGLLDDDEKKEVVD